MTTTEIEVNAKQIDEVRATCKIFDPADAIKRILAEEKATRQAEAQKKREEEQAQKKGEKKERERRKQAEAKRKAESTLTLRPGKGPDRKRSRGEDEELLANFRRLLEASFWLLRSWWADRPGQH